MPKLIGIVYFDTISLGMQQAAEELGNVTVTTDGPTEANIDDQIAVIENYLSSGDIDGILFAANDPVTISPVLKSPSAIKVLFTTTPCSFRAVRYPSKRSRYKVASLMDGAAKE